MSFNFKTDAIKTRHPMFAKLKLLLVFFLKLRF